MTWYRASAQTSDMNRSPATSMPAPPNPLDGTTGGIGFMTANAELDGVSHQPRPMQGQIREVPSVPSNLC